MEDGGLSERQHDGHQDNQGEEQNDVGHTLPDNAILESANLSQAHISAMHDPSIANAGVAEHQDLKPIDPTDALFASDADHPSGRPATKSENQRPSITGQSSVEKRASGGRKDTFNPVEGRKSASFAADVIAETADEEEQPTAPSFTSMTHHIMETEEKIVEEPMFEMEDSGWETDLDVSDILNRKNTTDPYIAACKRLNIVPISYVMQRLNGQEIVMPHHGLGSKGAEALAAVLGTNSTLQKLDLTSNWIEAGGAHLGRSLQINRTLAYLNLTGNRLGFEGSQEIAEMLHFNATLKTLILKDNSLGDREAKLFGEGLRQNSSLQALDLSSNEIGDIGAIALGAGIGANDGLKELNLAWNRIRPRGIAGLLNGIKDNGALTYLNLEANGVGENGQAIGAFLAKNNVIQVLNLRRTRLSDGAMGPVGKALEQNYSLKELDLSDNQWKDTGATPLFKGLLNSSSMRRFVMRNIKLTKDIRPKIDELKNEKQDLVIVEMSEADEMIAEKEARIRALARRKEDDIVKEE